MADIALSTLNARYIHAAFGLRYLYANLADDLRTRAAIVEFDIQQHPVEIVESLLSRHPRIVGLGVYIWNIAQTTEVVAMLKRVAPEVAVVIGGPEVSYELEGLSIGSMADVIITGEADLKFGEVCRDLLDGRSLPGKIIAAGLPDVAALRHPYDAYTAHDLEHRVVYVEASRGCPFTCEFCLSSLEVPVRAFPLQPFLDSMETLLSRGLLRFKFVDRTFNLNLPTSQAILEFFLARLRPGLFIHFEMVPDRLPEALREIIRKFPPGSLQFEVGVQTFDEATSERIRRRQNVARLEDNLRFLREQTGVHVHADLIAGLPGESLESFARGFDRLVGLKPQEIQVGILKRLRGTPIVRHDDAFAMAYSPVAPYEILSTRDIAFGDMQRVRRFSRYWDLLANSGHFAESLGLIWADGRSPFDAFMEWSDWLHGRIGVRHGIALATLFTELFRFLTEVRGLDPAVAGGSLARDYRRPGRKDPPECLRPWDAPEPRAREHRSTRLPKRQARHAAGVLLKRP